MGEEPNNRSTVTTAPRGVLGRAWDWSKTGVRTLVFTLDAIELLVGVLILIGVVIAAVLSITGS